MKKRGKISILLILIIIGVIVANIFRETTIGKEEAEEVLKNIEDIDNNIIVEYSYRNFAWEKQYNGYIFLKGGHIYEFDANGSTDNSNSKYGKIKATNQKVSTKDLKLMKEYILSLDSNYIEKYTGCDIGEKGIYVWKDNKKITLYSEGDSQITNKSKNTDKLIDLIKKYVKSANRSCRSFFNI